MIGLIRSRRRPTASPRLADVATWQRRSKYADDLVGVLGLEQLAGDLLGSG